MIWHLLAVLKAIDCRVGDEGPWHGGSYAARALVRNFGAVRETGGFKPVFDLLMRKAPWRIKLALLLTGRPG